jgi:hypothetical protein
VAQRFTAAISGPFIEIGFLAADLLNAASLLVQVEQSPQRAVRSFHAANSQLMESLFTTITSG